MLRLTQFSQPVCRQISIAKRHGTSISVILLENMEKRGSKGDVVPVKRGFARNFLIPRKKAGKIHHMIFFYILLICDPPAYATVLNQQKFKHLAEEAALEAASKVAVTKPHDNLVNFVNNKKTLVLSRECSPETKTLYAAITAEEVVKSFAQDNVPVKNVKFAEPIKTLGEYTIVVDTLNVALQVQQPVSN